MESIKQIYRIGHGPSSSHTMGPMRAAQMFVERNRGAVRFNVTLYGSLAATGERPHDGCCHPGSVAAGC